MKEASISNIIEYNNIHIYIYNFHVYKTRIKLSMEGGPESIQNLTGIRQRLNQEIVHVFESKSKSKAGYRIADLKTKLQYFDHRPSRSLISSIIDI